MIKELTIDNIDIINNSFLKKEEVLNDFNTNPFSKYLLLIKDNQVIAYVYYSDIYERAEINQIEVQDINRNCGYGKELMKFLTETVDKDITLEVRKDNIPALKLYKEFNFKEVAIRKGYYNGIDGILMERKKDS